MQRLVGIETEYGLLVEGKHPSDLVEEAIAVVQSCPYPWAGPWDYRLEDPRRDARGFQVEKLATDPEDAKFEKPPPKPRTREEERSDRVLANGARLYNDHGHPEYSTPECRDLLDLITHDRAGECIVLQCAQRRSAQEGAPQVQIYKNNTDFHGASYGCHEDYLVQREVPIEVLIQSLIPFLITRQIYAGAGKVGQEPWPMFGKGCKYQLSQRADFCTVEASVDTLAQRPIFNTRDEPHADPRYWRRLHVIVGDANMSEYATALKIGTTSLVLDLLEQGWRPMIAVANPVETIKKISRDPDFQWIVPLKEGGTISAIDLQRIYLKEAEKAFSGRDQETDWLLEQWRWTLDCLERDPLSLADRLDWAIKYHLLEEFVKDEGLDWYKDLSYLQSLDLEYHNLDPEKGLFRALEAEGGVLRLTTEEQVQEAIHLPPRNTRAFLRGFCVSRFTPQIRSLTWGRLTLADSQGLLEVELRDLVDGRVVDYNRRVEKAETLEDFLQVLAETDREQRASSDCPPS